MQVGAWDMYSVVSTVGKYIVTYYVRCNGKWHDQRAQHEHNCRLVRPVFRLEPNCLPIGGAHYCS